MKQQIETPKQSEMIVNEKEALIKPAESKKSCGYWCNLFCANPRWIDKMLEIGVTPVYPH